MMLVNMAAPKSSFQRKGKSHIFQIPGTKPSLHNNQLLVSTGVPSLDVVLGGGIAVGTVLLIEEDKYGSYSHMLLKYNLSEGVMCGHHLLVASADLPPGKLLQELPAALVDDPGTQSGQGSSEKAGEGDMAIAWRYQHLPQVQPQMGAGTKFGHYYDLTKTMDSSHVEKIPHTLVDLTRNLAKEQQTGTSDGVMNGNYTQVLQEVQRCINEGEFSTASQKQHRNILRIGLHSLASPLWGDPSSSNTDLCRFLYALRSLLRAAFAVCVITMPTHLFADQALTKRVSHLCDTVVRIEAFAGSDKEKNPVYKEYHGLFHLVKLPRLNSLTCHMPDTLDLAFKLRRKKFMIEKLHLPPELSDTASRSQEDPILPKPGALSCGTGANKLDF